MKLLANIARFLVGVLFIISGFIKANDPLGFSYKLDEYFVVFHMEWLSAISLGLAIFICAAEIGLGVATLAGAKMNFTSWSLLLMIVFFTFLSFYSWYFNKVTDCGCFGDALHLTPLQSFAFPYGWPGVRRRRVCMCKSCHALNAVPDGAYAYG